MTPLRDAHGTLIGFSNITQDITERKQAEEALQHVHHELETRVAERTAELTRANVSLRSERNFAAAVLDTVGALVGVVDREGRIVRFNRACEQALGYSTDAVIGRPFWELLPSEIDWPISLADVEPYYDRAEAKLGITGTNGIPQLPANNNYKAGFASALMLKDLKLAQEAAAAAGASTPLGAAAAQLFGLHNAWGEGGTDFSGIIHLIRGKGGA